MTRLPIPSPPQARRLLAVAATGLALGLTACGGDDAKSDAPSTATTAAKASRVTLENCGTPITFPTPARRLFVNDGNMISMALAIGAADQVAAVSSMQRDAPVLRKRYGAAVDRLHDVSKTYPARETVLAQRPDVMVAGWGYGWDPAKALTPDTLAKAGIAAYTLTESCKRRGSKARGVVDPWTALRTDLGNLGRITGREAAASKAIDGIDARLKALRAAPKAEKPPVIFLFDSGTKAVYSSGRLGAPQAILDAAGGTNALADLQDTWTEVSWERVITSKPDAFLFVDYPPQTFAQKIKVLESRAGVRELPAVREKRFLNLPYAMWTSGPLNVDAAEQTRKALEGWGLVPKSEIAVREGSDAAS